MSQKIERSICADFEDLERCILLSHRRTKRCEFSALLLLPLCIDSTPKVIALFSHLHENFFIRMPMTVDTLSFYADTFGVLQAKLERPTPDGFIADIHTAWRGRTFDIPVNQRKTEVEPNSLLNNAWVKPVPDIENFFMLKNSTTRVKKDS